MALQKDDIQIVFSDVDGTLVHYPKSNEEKQTDAAIIALPPSSTGMQGIISQKTLVLCELIGLMGKKLVLVSGMRTATLLKRLPYLPRADAYCSEAGGRIFYPVKELSGSNSNSFSVKPVRFQGALAEDFDEFHIVEDIEWRARMEKPTAAGRDGYICSDLGYDGAFIPVQQRQGLLWEFARTLMEKGFVLDTRGYSSCFRVNRKQQNKVGSQDFDLLASGKLLSVPPGLASSVNLGCVDFYPSESGKKNCCLYLAKKFCGSQDNSVLSKYAVCLCDDDNDLEMALACEHAYIPGVSSKSMEKTIEENADHMTLTGGTVHGTDATEAALGLVLDRLNSN